MMATVKSKNSKGQGSKGSEQKQGKALPFVDLKKRTDKDDNSVTLVVHNLDDFKADKKVHKALDAIDGLEYTKENIEKANKVIADLGLQRKPKEDAKAAGKKDEKGEPPFKPRTWTLETGEDGAEETWTEVNPKMGHKKDGSLDGSRLEGLNVLRIVPGNPKAKKKAEKEDQITLHRIAVMGQQTAWLYNEETEDMEPLAPEMIWERREWPTDDEGEFDDKMKAQTVAHLIPVYVKAEKEEE